MDLHGQEGAFSFQIRGGATFPMGSFGKNGAGWQGESGKGLSFGMGFTLPAPGPLGGFMGFSQHRFSCAQEVCPKGEGWIATGFDVALRQVVGEERIRGWVQAGLHTLHLEGMGLGGDPEGIPLVSDLGLGFEVGGGVLVAIGRRTSLSPGIRYGWNRTPFSERDDILLQYLLVDLGVVLGF
jgi:hypothetical protein